MLLVNVSEIKSWGLLVKCVLILIQCNRNAKIPIINLLFSFFFEKISWLLLWLIGFIFFLFFICSYILLILCFNFFFGHNEPISSSLWWALTSLVFWRYGIFWSFCSSISKIRTSSELGAINWIFEVYLRFLLMLVEIKCLRLIEIIYGPHIHKICILLLFPMWLLILPNIILLNIILCPLHITPHIIWIIFICVLNFLALSLCNLFIFTYISSSRSASFPISSCTIITSISITILVIVLNIIILLI